MLYILYQSINWSCQYNVLLWLILLQINAWCCCGDWMWYVFLKCWTLAWISHSWNHRFIVIIEAIVYWKLAERQMLFSWFVCIISDMCYGQSNRKQYRPCPRSHLETVELTVPKASILYFAKRTKCKRQTCEWHRLQVFCTHYKNVSYHNYSNRKMFCSNSSILIKNIDKKQGIEETPQPGDLTAGQQQQIGWIITTKDYESFQKTQTYTPSPPPPPKTTAITTNRIWKTVWVLKLWVPWIQNLYVQFSFIDD